MIRVNEKFDVAWRPDMTVRDLLVACHFTFPLINVTVNGQLVPKAEWDRVKLDDGVDVRVIHLITGG